MAMELRVPEVGESVSEVQIGEWACSEGDRVQRDQAVVAIETDKVTLEIHAPATGRLVRVLLPKGASARVGDVVGWFEVDEGTAGVAASAAASPPASSSGATRPNPAQGASAPDNPRTPLESTAPWASPAVRRALAERGVRTEDAAAHSAARSEQDSGQDSRMERTTASVKNVALPSIDGDGLRQPAQADLSLPGAEGLEDIVRMSPLRQRVAERLLEAQRTMALLTTFNEVDMSAVQQIRHEVQDTFIAKHGIKLGLMSFFVRAALEALKAFPGVNAEVRGSDIVYKNHYDIGIAVGSGRGLVVPVLRHVERLGFSAIERAIADFAARAKQNKLELSELAGGTFTISNGGVYGSMLSTPIVNPPQSAILGLHAITDRPVARNGQVVVRPMMYVALTYDHRIIDGREAVSFLRTIKDLIENPIRVLLEI